MFALLRLATAGTPKVDYIKPKAEDAAFGINYFSGSGRKSSLTMKDAGHYVGFRVYNGETKGQVHLLTQSGSASFDGITVSQKHQTQTLKRISGSKFIDVNYLKIQFDVQSTGSTAKRFDLGVFADSAFASRDDAILEVREDKRGVKITNPSTPAMRATYVLKGQYFLDVDTIYIGEDSTTDYLDHTNYPFFENNENAPPAEKDTVLAFSWKNKTVYPEQPFSIGFLLVQGDTVDLPPFVVDKTSPTEIEKDQEGTITVEVANYEEQEVTFKLFINGATEPTVTQTYKTLQNESYAHNFTYKTKLNGAKSLSYTAYATDSLGMKSNEITGKLVEAGGKAPRIEITMSPESAYDPNVQIHVEGKVYNDGPATVYYKFDDLTPKTYYDYDEISSEGEYFDIRTTFPGALKSGDHTITIWAVDDSTQAKSQEKTLSFKINPPPGPTVYSAYASEFKVQPGRTIIIFGEANDPNDGQNLDIKVKFGDVRDEEFLGQIVAGDPLDPFAFTYEIPDVNQGKYVVHITATDGTYTSTEANFTIQVVGADREVVEYANLTDVTSVTFDREFGKATFDVNLRYKNRNHELTQGNLGIFSAFKVDGSDDLNTITYKEYQTKTAGNINVTAYSRYEAQTGFFQLVWNVHNEGPQAKSIDLGVFYDSSISYNDNNTMEIRNDGRGVRMLDYDTVEKAAISYTVFLKDYGNYPSVDSWYFKPVPTDEYGEIDPKNMPFFKNSDDIEKNGNAMIAFSWNKRLIGAGQTVEFVATFVGDWDAFDPTKILDWTRPQYPPNNVLPGEFVDVTFIIQDGDIGQKLNLNITINGEAIQDVVTIGEDGFASWQNQYIITKEMKTFHYTCQAVDALDPRSVSNLIDNSIPVGYPPSLNVYNEYFKPKYFPGDQVHIVGWASDEEAVIIKYKFDDGEDIVYKRFEITEESQYATLDFNITLPAYLGLGQHILYVWAEDPYGFEDHTGDISLDGHLINIVEKNPPVLLKAGFNSKTTKAGQKLIAYSMISHNDIGTHVTAQVKFGDRDWVTCPKNVEATSPPAPFAWYVEVPTGLEAGTYQVQIRAVDEDGLVSEKILGQTIQLNK